MTTSTPSSLDARMTEVTRRVAKGRVSRDRKAGLTARMRRAEASFHRKLIANNPTRKAPTRSAQSEQEKRCGVVAAKLGMRLDFRRDGSATLNRGSRTSHFKDLPVLEQVLQFHSRRLGRLGR